MRDFVRSSMIKPTPGKEWSWALESSIYRPSDALKRKKARELLELQRKEAVQAQESTFIAEANSNSLTVASLKVPSEDSTQASKPNDSTVASLTVPSEE